MKPESIEPVEGHKEIELFPGRSGTTIIIGSQMNPDLEALTIDFLRKNSDMLAWSPSDFQEWLSNVVVVPKASGKWRMCTDFTDLNKACPKDPYPLPRIDLLVDSTAGCVLFRATYQRLVNRMFKDLIGNTMEVYVDGMLIKSKVEKEHLEHLESAFTIMRTYGMKLNLNEVHVWGLRGKSFRLYGQRARDQSQPGENRSHLTAWCAKNDQGRPEAGGKIKDFQWTEECEKALSDLKEYLTTPPLLANPIVGERLYIYLAVSENAISSELVREEQREQRPVYYISRMLQGAEKKYIQIEKLALALVTTAHKLRPYFQSHPIMVLTNHPLKQVMAKPDVPEEQGQQEEDGWMLHVDGSSNKTNGGAGIFLQGPGGVEIEIAVKLNFPATNNEAEYEALVQGLRAIWEGGVKQLGVCTNSQLVAMQIEGLYETREWSMIPKEENGRADALSKFGAMVSGVKEMKVVITVRDTPTIEEVAINVVEGEESWKTQFIRYLKNGTLPSDPIVAKRVHFKANRFGVPRILISDNGAQFQGRKIAAWCKELKIQQHFTAVENPQTNGQTEVTNRIMLQHLKTRLDGAKGSWIEDLPAKIGEETTRVSQYEQKRNAEERSFDLSTIEEKRDRAYARILHYKNLMTRGYNQKVKPQSFQVGDLVLKKVEVSKHVVKLDPTWEGPYKVIEIRKKGTYALQDLEGKNLPRPWNIHNLKKFYA
ncbi:UNVERIFIED_CONTAM: hypothetical protein Slati_2674900 [Sesamum latifolium]|uniref:Integrase catalytic domain-containing protein n=1 Tax=Sesamum latifolium TaxID=2727402 RepID=A0AAW2VZS7_9LAMI